MIVGEQDEALDVLGRGAGVVAQPRQREIGPERVEQRERADRVGHARQHAVGDLVADVGELGRGEPARQFGRADVVEREQQSST